MQLYFYRFKLTKKLTSTFKKMIFLSSCAQCMGHNWIKHRELSDKEKEELK